VRLRDGFGWCWPPTPMALYRRGPTRPISRPRAADSHYLDRLYRSYEWTDEARRGVLPPHPGESARCLTKSLCRRQPAQLCHSHELGFLTYCPANGDDWTRRCSNWLECDAGRHGTQVLVFFKFMCACSLQKYNFVSQ
jgi:hypothetical protein